MNFQIGGQKKYGLITRKPPANSSSSHVLKKSVLNTIDDEEDHVADINKVNQELARLRQIESERILVESQSALSENPDIFDYDSYVDTKSNHEDKRSKLSQSLSSSEAKVQTFLVLQYTEYFTSILFTCRDHGTLQIL